MSDIPALVDELVAALKSDVHRLELELAAANDRLDTASKLLAAGAPEPIAPASSTPASKKKSHPCPDCDFVATAAAGLGAHRRAKHGTKGATTTPRPRNPQSPDASKVYRCSHVTDDSACGAEFDKVMDLSVHTTTFHQRQPTQGERILVTSDRAR